MKDVSSSTMAPQSAPEVRLVTVFSVHADDSYDVKRPKGDPNTYELFRSLSGHGRVEFRDGTSAEATGDTVIIARNDQLAHYACLGGEWRFWWFRFHWNDTSALPLREALTVEGAIADEVYGSQCLSLLREDTPQSSAQASAVLAFLLGKWAWQLNRSAIRLDPHREAVSRVIEMMHHRLGERLSVNSMAKIANLSQRRFRQVFENHTGSSPKKYFDRLRLETAAQMLITTSLSIAELADMLGYSSQFHFSRAFKAYFGKAPTSYRQ